MTQAPLSGNELPQGIAEQNPHSKRRRLLVALLGGQILLLFLIFPWLLVHFENEHNRQELPQANEMTVAEPTLAHAYSQGLYWSLITPIRMDGDKTWPQSRNGRILVRVSDATKVLTIGTLARLFYDIITTRRMQPAIGIGYLRSRHRIDEGVDDLADGPAPETFVTTRGRFIVFYSQSPKEIARLLVDLLLTPSKAKQDSMNPGTSRNGHTPTDQA